MSKLYTVNQLARELRVPRASVRHWVRKIGLTLEQVPTDDARVTVGVLNQEQASMVIELSGINWQELQERKKQSGNRNDRKYR